jgi:hypothetical protein
MIVKIKPDKEKASALKKMAEISLERLSCTELIEYPSNSLTDYYDIIHKLMEALASIKGYKTRGDSAHIELIDFICKEEKFDEMTRELLQQMRDYRNRVSYEGFMIHKNYILLNEEKIKKIISKLINSIEKYFH